MVIDQEMAQSITIGKMVRTIVLTRSENDADQLALAGSRDHSQRY